MTKTKTTLYYLITLVIVLTSCSKDSVMPNLRKKIDYNTLAAETPYSQLFVDSHGNSTVDVTDGNHRLKMFQSLNYYSSSSVTANTHIDAVKLKNMFSNSGSPFYDISTSTISVIGAELNTSTVQIKNAVASSLASAQADAIRTTIEGYFDQIDAASNSINSTAVAGQAGKLGNYLVDAKGIEYAQVIQKSLIGGLQLDYISNQLLNDGLNAENHKVISGENFTQLENNWDVAYGLLTLNQVYLLGATDANRNTIEFAAGSYIWEYNKTNYAKIFPAFLRGRAAIVNNDRTELLKQATFIRTEFEKTIAMAALGYLDKWKTGTTDAARAHAIGEGLGFVYSLRFAKIHGADAAFSDNIMNGLIGSTNGFWDLTADKINTASSAIKSKFGL